ncbi:MAG: hypothetical protein M3O03_11975 [Pseudomonadota bacterium]|nr:hypothetical protein [Pseudomonadota bacterium]
MDSVADTVFLRRILYAMIGLTMLAGILATVTAVQAMTADTLVCVSDCQQDS